MADYVIPEPEPKEIDEKTSMELRHLAGNAVLKGKPSGEEKCENCRYYLEPYADLSYCWHSKLRILVGDEWWCQWWNAIPRTRRADLQFDAHLLLPTQCDAIERIVKADGS